MKYTLYPIIRFVGPPLTFSVGVLFVLNGILQLYYILNSMRMCVTPPEDVIFQYFVSITMQLIMGAVLMLHSFYAILHLYEEICGGDDQ